MIHVAAGNLTVAVNSAITIAVETVILLIMFPFNNTIVAGDRGNFLGYSSDSGTESCPNPFVVPEKIRYILQGIR